MTIEFIRQAYNVDFKIGQQVRIRNAAGTSFDGQSGKLIRAHYQYLKVRGDGWEGLFHPRDVEHAKEPSP